MALCANVARSACRGYASRMDHIEWLSATAKDDSSRVIGRRSGVSFRTIADQIERGRISAENVIAIAIGYDVHPVTALIDCDYLPAQYATKADPVAALREVSEDALAEEVLRRMKLVGDHTVFTTPIDELVDSSDDAEMTVANGVIAASAAELEVDSADDDRDETG